MASGALNCHAGPRAVFFTIIAAAGAAGRPQRSAEAATFRSLPQQARNGGERPSEPKGRSARCCSGPSQSSRCPFRAGVAFSGAATSQQFMSVVLCEFDAIVDSQPNLVQGFGQCLLDVVVRSLPVGCRDNRPAVLCNERLTNPSLRLLLLAALGCRR